MSFFYDCPWIIINRSIFCRQRWHIPFTYTIEKINSINTSFTNFVDLNSLSDKIIWLKPNDSQTHIPIYEVLDKDTFILANIDFAGYYRVNYEPENWEKIIKQLTLNRNVMFDLTFF